MSSGPPFKRSKPSADLEAIRFKYFSMPPELKALIDEQSAKDGLDSPEWLNSMADRLVSTGLSQEQLTKLVATKLPSVNAPNSHKLLDYVKDIIAGKLGGGHYAHKDERGNKNFKYTGVELQPVRPDGSLIGGGGLIDDDDEANERDGEEEKLQKPPEFSSDDLTLIRQKVKIKKYIRDVAVLTGHPHEQSRDRDSLAAGNQPVRQAEISGLDSLLNSMTIKLQSSNSSILPLFMFSAYLACETLMLAVWTAFDLQETVWSPSLGLRVALAALLLYDYIFGHIKYLNWLWLVVGSYTRFLLKTMAVGLIVTRLPSVGLRILETTALYSAVRLGALLVQPKMSAAMQIAMILATMIAALVIAMKPYLDAIAQTSAGGLQMSAQIELALAAACTVALLILYEWELLTAQVLLRREEQEHSRVYTAVEVAEEILGRVLVLPYQIKRCKLSRGSMDRRMYPNAIVV